MAKELNGYDLSRKWFDWCFENPEKISPNHTALYFFIIEHCNRLGWKSKFGLPTTMAKESIGIRSYNTYINTLNDLVNWGAIIMIEKSKNQFSSNIIAISNFDKALDKALDKAFIKHGTKQVESTSESIYSIDKPINKETIKQINNKPLEQSNIKLTIIEYEKLVNEFTEPIILSSIKFLSDYKLEKGYKTKSDNLTIRRWVIKAVKEQIQKQPKGNIIDEALKSHEIAMKLIDEKYGNANNSNGQGSY